MAGVTGDLDGAPVMAPHKEPDFVPLHKMINNTDTIDWQIVRASRTPGALPLLARF
jgi:hypothetical protein